MSATLLQKEHGTVWPVPPVPPVPAIPPVPPGVLRHTRLPSESDSGLVAPEVLGNEKPTYLHPGVAVAAAGGQAWLVAVCWIVFGGDGYMSLSLVMITLVSCLLIGLGFLGGNRNLAPWQRPWRSFREFLSGDVAVWGGSVPARGAFIQLIALSWSLAALFTFVGVAVELVRP